MNRNLNVKLTLNLKKSRKRSKTPRKSLRSLRSLRRKKVGVKKPNKSKKSRKSVYPSHQPMLTLQNSLHCLKKKRKHPKMTRSWL